MKNKIIVILIALTMLGRVTLTASAISTSGGTGESSAILNQEQTSFNVTVPTSLPVAVDRDGVVTTASDVKIHNNSYGPVVISDIRVDILNGWSLVDFDKDMGTSTVGLKEFGLIIQGDEVQSNGDVGLTPASWEGIPGNGSMQLNYDAIISPQKTALSDVNIANVVFILGWDDIYTLATDADFSKVNGNFRYIGKDEYVEIPHVIQGVAVTSTADMFRRTSVKGVKSTNTNVTDMRFMFRGFLGKSLDLRNFDTSSVTDMSGMFYESAAKSLDLRNFDTSSVTTMYCMFYCSQATTLDLSSFDTTSVTDVGGMFQQSGVTTVYAGTQADADKFNTAYYSPTGLTFIVKE